MVNQTRIILFTTVVFAIIGAVVLIYKLPIHGKPALSVIVSNDSVSTDGYVGSRSCRECHNRFYNLWSPSHHGKAMQPVVDVIRNNELVIPDSLQKVGNQWFEVLLDGESLYMIEKDTNDGQKEVNRYQAKWALGGRNIYYFLASFTGGRLQTMPLAYDINRKEWYSNPSSAVRHFVDTNAFDEEINWTHSLYTFNTTCHNCHVSQLEKNYDIRTNTYKTTWKEPGINCETCHGPSEEHIKICREAEKRNMVPEDLKIISVKNYTPSQHNAACASCHAKGSPLTNTYEPGDSFFQNFDLLTLENPDYYPDGRDLGENYTMTSWLQSKCTKDASLSCVTCHTSSGRYKFKNKDNDICGSCHQDKVENFEEHSFHKVEDSISCVSCHMPKTEFARMTRSDHSMRPPAPKMTIEFGSPNACTICHTDKDAQWANNYVTKWHGNYQEVVLEQARLIFEGRNGDYTRSSQMLAMIKNPEINIIFRNSIIRILSNYQKKEYTNYFLNALRDQSPLIRSSAAEALRSTVNLETKNALISMLTDSILLVRIKATGSLSSFPKELFSQVEWISLEKSFKEYEDYIMAYPDTWSAHYNMGNYFQSRKMYRNAVTSYEKAIQFEEETILPMVNASIAYNLLGNNIEAENKLLQALRLEPDNPTIHLNYGLLLAETKRFDESKKHLITALEKDSTISDAAYNLAVISAQSNLKEALKYIAQAYKISPDNPKYGYTYAYYSFQDRNLQHAIVLLDHLIKITPEYLDAYLFLGTIYEEINNPRAAISIYEKASKLENIPTAYLQNFQSRVSRLKY